MNDGINVDIRIYKNHALFLAGLSLILILFGFNFDNYSTAFLGACFFSLSLLCYILTTKNKLKLASYFWAIATPILITSSVLFFSTKEATTLFSYSYLYLGGYIFCTYTLKKKENKNILILSTALFFAGYLSYDSIIISQSVFNSDEINFYLNHKNYFIITRSIHFITIIYFVYLLQKHRYELESTFNLKVEKLHKYAANLISSAKSKLILKNDLKGSLEEVLVNTANVLDISRIGIWEYNVERKSIQLVVAYDKTNDSFSYEGELFQNDYPIYFKMILEEKTVAAPDASLNESMQEFNNGYFQEHKILSMLDTPFFIDGDFKGILCFEEQKQKRDWDEMDYLYSMSVSKLVSTSYYWAEKMHNHKKLEETIKKLENTKNELTKANQAKTMFLANMSHEIRTPLNAILGFSELLTTIKDMSADESKDYLNKINTGATNLTAILNSILDISAIESGKLSLNHETVNVTHLFQNLIDFNHSQLPPNTSLELKIKNKLPEYIWVDKIRLSQIASNLITNACKFGKGDLISVELDYLDNELKIEVTDRGIGIDEKRQRAIFESFEQSDKSIKKEYGGSGLGLAIVSTLLKLMGGSIDVRSELGKGSCFSISIPAKSIELTEISVVDKNQESIDPKRKFITLVVEDDDMNQILIEKIFSNLKLKLVLLENGQKALEYVKQNKPDLILMDLHMPVMNGFEATKQIRKIYSSEELPIVALSADAYLEQKQEALTLGFNDYLTKPLQINELKAILLEFMN